MQSRFYVEFAAIFAPTGLDSKAQGGSPGKRGSIDSIKAQRAVTCWRGRVTVRWALRDVWLAISQGCRPGLSSGTPLGARSQNLRRIATTLLPKSGWDVWVAEPHAVTEAAFTLWFLRHPDVQSND